MHADAHAPMSHSLLMRSALAFHRYHKGYGRLWSLALSHSDVYALTHRGLTGADISALDREGAVSIAGEYASAVEVSFTSASVNLIGASFGAVLASHVARAARALGGSLWRLVLLDSPPAAPRELPVRDMNLSRLSPPPMMQPASAPKRDVSAFAIGGSGAVKAL